MSLSGSFIFSIGLLLDIKLGATLLGLALVVLVLVFGLRLRVAGESSKSRSGGTGNPIANTRHVIVDLTFGFLILALSVLVASRRLNRLYQTCVNFIHR